MTSAHGLQSPDGGAPGGGGVGTPHAVGHTTSVILPTYNEGLVIAGVVREILEAVPDAEVLVVDDDSPDRTWQTVETTFAGDARVRALRRVGRRGLPSALAEGVTGTNGGVVVWLDADGSMPADINPRLVAAMAGSDVAVASRYAAGGSDARDSRLRILASRAINLVATVCLGGPVRDWTSGFVAARRTAMERVPLRTHYVYGDYCIDFLYRAYRTGLRVVEVPYRNVERRAGVTKTSADPGRFAALGLRYVGTILQLRWQTLFTGPAAMRQPPACGPHNPGGGGPGGEPPGGRDATQAEASRRPGDPLVRTPPSDKRSAS